MSPQPDFTLLPCASCGQMFALNRAEYSTAVHDCGSGDWTVLPRAMSDELNAMSDEQAAAWAGVDVADVRALRGGKRS